MMFSELVSSNTALLLLVLHRFVTEKIKEDHSKLLRLPRSGSSVTNVGKIGWSKGVRF